MMQAELEADLGYAKNDSKNKTTDNSRNERSGHQIISMYAKGMSTRDIASHIESLYGAQISADTISRITDKILPEIKEWQNRPLKPLYALMFFDAIHYPVRTEGAVRQRAVYIAIGIDMDGGRGVCGLWIGESIRKPTSSAALCTRFVTP